MSGLDEGESKLKFQSVEEKAELSEITDKIKETDKNAEENSCVKQRSESNVSGFKDFVLSDLGKEATEVSSKSHFSDGLEFESESENSGLTSNVKKNELSLNNTKDYTKDVSSAIVEGPNVKDLKDDSFPRTEFLSEKFYGETTSYDEVDEIMVSSFENLADCAEKAICECPKGYIKEVGTHDLDDEIPPLVKAQDEVPSVSENGRMKQFTWSTIKPSLDVENESSKSQKCESVKGSRDENHKLEPSNLTNVDSGEDTGELSMTFDEVVIVHDSNKPNGEKYAGDWKMSDMPVINVTVLGAKLKYSSLSRTEKVFVPKNVDKDNELSEIPKHASGKMLEMPMINIKVSEGELRYPSLSSTEKVFVPKKVADESLRLSPSPIPDLKAANADGDKLSEIPEVVKGKMSDMPTININASEGKQYPILSSTEKILVPKTTVDEPLHLNPSPTTDLKTTNADEDNDLSDLPELVPLNMPIKSPTQLKIDYFRELEGSSSRCECPPSMSPRKLFPKSKSPSSLEKPSPKKSTPEKAVTESEHHIVPVLQSSVACGSDTMSDKPLEPKNEICPKCEGQVTKISEGKEEILKCIPKSKYLYCIAISGPKCHAKSMEHKLACTGRRFRILLNVSLFDTESLSIKKIGDKIDVYGKQVNKNEFGEEIYEMHKVFRIPLFVDDSCFTASITENEMLLIDAPFKGNEEDSTKK